MWQPSPLLSETSPSSSNPSQMPMNVAQKLNKTPWQIEQTRMHGASWCNYFVMDQINIITKCEGSGGDGSWAPGHPVQP